MQILFVTWIHLSVASSRLPYVTGQDHQQPSEREIVQGQITFKNCIARIPVKENNVSLYLFVPGMKFMHYRYTYIEKPEDGECKKCELLGATCF